MRYGVQMYGLNPIFLKDKEAFLKRITAAGFRYMEPCVTLSPIPGLEDRVWLPADFASNRPLLQKYGVKTNSCHVFTQNILEDLPGLIPLAKENGIRQLVLPCPKQINPAVSIDLTRAGDALREQGMELLLHNDRGDDGYEWLLKACGDSVGAQADVGWLLHNGIDPEAFLWRNRDKVRSLHYKDFRQTPDGLKENAIGKGLVDMTACFQFARAAEIIQIMDQDGSDGDFLADVDAAGSLLQSLCDCRERSKSTLCILDTQTGQLKKLHEFPYVIEAPNWLQTEEDVLIYNSGGHIWRYEISTDASQKIDSGCCDNCNNDHVLSPDNTHIAVSHSSSGWMSQIYILPTAGGVPRLITPNAPSFLHGWSPDGEELAYCAFRDHGKGMEVDVYAISVNGGEEWQLTKNAAFNDGPEYSPDGKHIWFNSTRSGLMQCWRMKRDGSEPTQMTFTQRNNWFPHVSPDGKKVVYLSYSQQGLDPAQHLPNMHVELYLMDADGSNNRKLLSFFGGQGSINVNSWHRDSRHLAMVLYELEHK